VTESTDNVEAQALVILKIGHEFQSRILYFAILVNNKPFTLF